ncbi:hypothetical protein K432DRAFT_321647 [Lepidopterella palustris CBS 459.81]|uniref:Nab2-like CCCH zinc finger domain-containing protein n=1 Tax=Lepidopterella palustris CBS 459.81 TaxID=1314670 RepID=A0A8E2EGU7_9PEZI|nr:hypothetical protein K432DRAFT_321647 [Lepidopterella palustris CBS 459.81]
MAVEVVAGTPLAHALQNVVQPKLAEAGWITGGLDDNALSEYIILMLANGKTQDEVSSELSNDLLDLGPDNESAISFSQWLFEQVDALDKQINGGKQSSAHEPASSGQQAHQNGGLNGSIPSSNYDAEMGDAAEAGAGAIPTGPKAMRNGSGVQKPRDKRMLGQLNKAMDRTDDSALHRVRGSSGTGRINSHSSRDPPRGPRNLALGRGIAAMANGRGMGTMGPMGGMNGMSGMNGMNGMPIPGMGPNGPNEPMTPVMTPQQQMALLQMYEQQAQMMQQLFSNQPMPSAFVNPNFHGAYQALPNKKSLFDRVGQQSQKHNERRPPQYSGKFAKKEQQDEAMTDGGEVGAKAESMDVEARPDPSQTMCRFNITCTKADCPFVHQSPAAPPGVSVDFSDTCPYAAACMNKKCVGKHPSPAQRESHKAEKDCMFFPHCRDPANCPFRHPSLPACRNGADCTVPNCKFAHSKVMCKFNPCTNYSCPYKHAEGQKRTTTFADRVWTANSNQNENNSGGQDQKESVSDRKFVDEDAEEELILPGRMSHEVETQIIT